MAVGMSSPRPARTTAVRAAAEEPTGPAAGPDGLAAGLDPDDLPDGLVVADERGHVTCFNTAATRITATSRAEAIGRP
ncbi:PAS domain-containing protein, partial [Streptomyces globisporus]